MPIILQRPFERVFMSNVDVTKDVVWVSNLVYNHVYIGVNIIFNKERFDCDGLIRVGFSMK